MYCGQYHMIASSSQLSSHIQNGTLETITIDPKNCVRVHPASAWESYREHVMDIDEVYWEAPREYDVKRQAERAENFSFLYRRVLFVGLNMVSNVANGER